MRWLARKFNHYIIPSLCYVYNIIVYFFSVKSPDVFIVLADFGSYGGTRTYFDQLCRFLHDKNKKVICLVCERQKDVAFVEMMKNLDFQYEEIPDRAYLLDHNGKFPIKLALLYLNKIVTELNLFILYCNKYKTSSFYISTGEPEKWIYLFWLPVNRMVYVLHTLPYRCIGKIGKMTLSKKLCRNKCLITVSEFAKESIVRNWEMDLQQKELIHVVPNFFVSSLTTKPTVIEEEIVRILTLGHVVYYKNPLLWIDIAKSVLSKEQGKKIEFIWAGDGELLEECRNKVKDCESIKFVGFQKNIEELYTNAHIYFQPSILESQGIAVIGAMYFELPCVVSDKGGLPESVMNGVNGFVISGDDVCEYVEKIMCLVQDQKIRTQMGRKGKQIFSEKFQKRHWVRKMSNLIGSRKNERI